MIYQTNGVNIMNKLIDNKIIEQIKSLLESARKKVAAEVNSTLIRPIGKSVRSSWKMNKNTKAAPSTANRR